MPKLTLRVSAEVLARAKQYAKLRDVSVSQMVEAYLKAIAEPQAAGEWATPILRSLRGVLTSGETSEYRKHLAAKYR